MNPRFAKRKPFGRPPHGPKTSWEGVSDWYGSHLKKEDTFQERLVFPGAERLLAPKKGERILDVACGEGAFSRMLAKAHDLHVVGIDAAPSLIQIAKRQAPKRADYETLDARELSKRFSPASFDAAACILAIQNIDPFAPVIEGVSRALKPGGRFVIVMNHPSFRIPRQSGWGWDEARKLQYRRVDKYLSSFEVPIQAHPGAAPDKKTWSYHRPLQAYVSALAANGFAVDAIEEWASHRKSEGGRAKAEDAARNEIPMFLALRAVKK